MVAAYPDVFTAGAVVAGLPVVVASNVSSVMGRMAHAGFDLGLAQWATLARVSALSHTERYPPLSVWQGGADRTVDPSNADDLVAQWRGLADLGLKSVLRETRQGGVRHRAWGEADRPMVEEWVVAGMAHGYPTETGTSPERFVIAAGIDATA